MGLTDNFRKGQELARKGQNFRDDSQEEINQQTANDEPIERVTVKPEKPGGRDLPTLAESTSRIQNVTIVDFDMPFGSMVSLMVKWALASIPAIIILSLISLACYMAFILFAQGLSR